MVCLCLRNVYMSRVSELSKVSMRMRDMVCLCLRNVYMSRVSELSKVSMRMRDMVCASVCGMSI